MLLVVVGPKEDPGRLLDVPGVATYRHVQRRGAGLGGLTTNSGRIDAEDGVRRARLLVVIGSGDVQQLPVMTRVLEEILDDVTRAVHGCQSVEAGRAVAFLDAVLVEEVVRDVSLISVGGLEVEQTVDGEVPVAPVMVRGDVPEDAVEISGCLVHCCELRSVGFSHWVGLTHACGITVVVLAACDTPSVYFTFLLLLWRHNLVKILVPLPLAHTSCAARHLCCLALTVDLCCLQIDTVYMYITGTDRLAESTATVDLIYD